MIRTYGEEMTHRKILREKYLETPGFRRWSDYMRQTMIDNHVDLSFYNTTYAGVDDDSLFISMITHKQPNDVSMDDIIHSFENGLNLPIHWNNFYAYFDEQLHDPNSRYRPSINIENLLDEYRDTLLNNYDMV